MTRWAQPTFVTNVLCFAATVLMLASQANAQSQTASVGGAWETTWGGGQAVLDLKQKGTAVTGIYSGTNDGKVNGTVAGNVLTGRWFGAANDSGAFVLTFSADGRSFNGTWGMGASKTDGGPWTGARK